MAVRNRVLHEVKWAVPRVDDLIRLLGLPMAAATVVDSVAYCVHDANAQVPGLAGLALFRHTLESDLDPAGWLPYAVPDTAIDHLRGLLARVDQPTYDATVVALEPFRTGLLCQRILTSFLIPERRAWVAADFADVPAGYRGPQRLLFYSAFDPAQIRDRWPTSLSEFVTTWDGLGVAAVPLLLRWFDRAWHQPDVEGELLDILSRIPDDAALTGLLVRLRWGDAVRAAVAAATARFPRRAFRVIAGRRDIPEAAALLGPLAKANPQLPESIALAVRRRPIAEDDVPALLASPPWTRTRRRLLRVTVPEQPPTIHWLAGEQEEWNSRWWPGSRDSDWEQHLQQKGADLWFFLSAPEELVRPRLSTWRPENAEWFYMFEPRVLVARYQLDALPPILHLAQRKPVIGAELLLPYRSSQVATLMARWLVGSRQFRPLARAWFDRHDSSAAELILPAVLGGKPAESRSAAMALARLDADVVRVAGARLGVRTEVNALLATDPLDLIPARVAAVPAWLDVDTMPQVLLRAGTHALRRPRSRP